MIITKRKKWHFSELEQTLSSSESFAEVITNHMNLCLRFQTRQTLASDPCKQSFHDMYTIITVYILKTKRHKCWQSKYHSLFSSSNFTLRHNYTIFTFTLWLVHLQFYPCACVIRPKYNLHPEILCLSLMQSSFKTRKINPQVNSDVQ